MPLDRTILLVTAIGALSGCLISLQVSVLDRLVNQQWVGWRITLKKFAFSTLSLGAIFGLSALMLPALSLGIPASQTIAFFAKIGLLISILTPLSGQILPLIRAQANADD